jgi:Chlorophyll A-B binding protein
LGCILAFNITLPYFNISPTIRPAMFRLTTLLACILTASAFHASARPSTKYSLKMGYEMEAGVVPPLGFFDPLGLLKNAPENEFKQLRTAELKHGRVAMLAVVGHMVTAAGVRCGGDIAYNLPYSGMKAGLAAFDTIPAWGTAQLILFIGLIEIGYGYQQKNIEEFCMAAMVDAKMDPKKKMTIELNNGRAAQMGILTLMVHEKLNNDPYVINAMLGSPVPFN